MYVYQLSNRRTVIRCFPTLVAEKPCIKASPAGNFDLSFFFRFDDLASASFFTEASGRTIALFARFLSRRSVKPIVSVSASTTIQEAITSDTYAQLLRRRRMGCALVSCRLMSLGFESLAALSLLRYGWMFFLANSPFCPGFW